MPRVASLVILFLVAGCERGDHCEGSVAVECHSSEGGGFSDTCSRTDCATQAEFGPYCAETPDGSSLCVKEKEPRPSCGDEPLTWACDGAEHVECQYGYPTKLTTCASAEHCTRTYVGCTARPGLDAGCMTAMAAGRYSYCDGSEAVRCDAGYAVEVESCGSPDLCYQSRPDESGVVVSVCVQSLVPDARCEPSGVFFFCEGEVSFHCIDGLLEEIEDCGAAGLFCTSSGHCNGSDY